LNIRPSRPGISSRNVVLTSQLETEMAKRLRAVRSGDRYGTGWALSGLALLSAVLLVTNYGS